MKTPEKALQQKAQASPLKVYEKGTGNSVNMLPVPFM